MKDSNDDFDHDDDRRIPQDEVRGFQSVTFDMEEDELDKTEPVTVRDKDGHVWKFETRPIPGKMARVVKSNPAAMLSDRIELALTDRGMEEFESWVEETDPSFPFMNKVMTEIYRAGMGSPTGKRKKGKRSRR